MTVRHTHILPFLVSMLLFASCTTKSTEDANWTPYQAEEEVLIDIPDVHGTGQEIVYEQNIVLKIPTYLMDAGLIHAISVNSARISPKHIANQGSFEYKLVNTLSGEVWSEGIIEIDPNNPEFEIPIQLSDLELNRLTQHLLTNYEIPLHLEGIAKGAPFEFAISIAVYGELLIE